MCLSLFSLSPLPPTQEAAAIISIERQKVAAAKAAAAAAEAAAAEAAAPTVQPALGS
jgi:hypothetical protein